MGLAAGSAVLFADEKVDMVINSSVKSLNGSKVETPHEYVRHNDVNDVGKVELADWLEFGLSKQRLGGR